MARQVQPAWAVKKKREPTVNLSSIFNRAINFLRENRTATSRHSRTDIERHLKVKLLGKYFQVWTRLLSNDRVKKVDGEWLRYKPEIDNVHVKEQLLTEIRKTKKGHYRKAVEDAYVDAKEDLRKLIDEKLVFVIRSPDIKDENLKEVVFPMPPSSNLVMDEKIKDLWHKINIPLEADLIDDLVKSGHLSNKEVIESNDFKAQISGIAQKRKKRQKSKQKRKRAQRLTNQHMKKDHAWLRDMEKQSRRR
mmetsp:Transcript_7570/g.11455  ORF Transcript_7570/g.11455 Transcript_7570/m.11455 type:complete len:249 (-) Transcript_7570:2-748(-)